jgi:hypothetical protein
MKKIALLAGVFLMIACGNGQTQAQGKTADDKKPANEGKYYTTAVAPGELAVSEKGTVILSLIPGSGYKWNDEYPAKFKLTAPASVALEKAEFSFKNKDIETDKKEARLSLPLTISAQGPQKLDVKGSFSVCNDTSCKIMRNEVFSITVQGK